MQQQRADNFNNIAKLTAVIEQLKEFRDEKVIPQYASFFQKDPTKDSQLKSIIQSNKAQLRKVFAEDKSKARTAEQILDQQKKEGLKKPLIQATDEDSDEDGNQLVRPVGIDSKIKPYEAPLLKIETDGLDELAELKKTPRNQLTPSQRQQVDQAVLEDVIEREVSKRVNTLPKDQDPNDPSIYKPLASPRISKNFLDNSLKEHFGQSPSQQSMLSQQSMFNAVKIGISSKLTDAINREVSKQMRLEQKEQQIAQEKLNAEGGKRAMKVVITPEYILDPRLNVYVETNQPPNTLFEPVGWDRIHNETHEKHYRRFYTQELENVKEVMKQPTDFNQYKLTKGQIRGAKAGLLGGLFSKAKTDESGEVDTSETVGLFKGLISVTKKSEQKKN